MNETIKLFKSILINESDKSYSNSIEFVKQYKEVCLQTIQYGYILNPSIINNLIINRSKDQIQNQILKINEIVGVSANQLNNTFHKSWNKIATAPIQQLIIEQLMHYLTTYGFKQLNVFSNDTVFIPNEILELPEFNQLKDINKLSLIIIQGITQSELKSKVFNMLQSGIALHENTINDIIKLLLYIDFNNAEIELIKNKEVRVILFDKLNIIPKNPIEFVRFMIYKEIGTTLIIKSKHIINELKNSTNNTSLELLHSYKQKYGLQSLAGSFNRFKPIYLALRKCNQSKHIINQISRLSKKHHIPMSDDYLNNVTNHIKNEQNININELKLELNKVNMFRKIRLAYALNYRTKDVNSILYKIRNGKGYIDSFEFKHKTEAKLILNVVLQSIIDELRLKVNGKRIFIQSNVKYALPSSEKQFTGDYPSGTCVSTSKDMIVGINWFDTNKTVDLDLALINLNGIKIGWNSDYRTENRDILFSGDITSAGGKYGATELFYIKPQSNNIALMTLNYYNHMNGDNDVPYKIIISDEHPLNFKSNYMVNPNNIIVKTDSNINVKQKMIGFVVSTEKQTKFYFAETIINNSISSKHTDKTDNARKYYYDYYTDSINFNELLKQAGAIIINELDKPIIKSINIDTSNDVSSNDVSSNDGSSNDGSSNDGSSNDGSSNDDDDKDIIKIDIDLSLGVVNKSTFIELLSN